MNYNNNNQTLNVRNINSKSIKTNNIEIGHVVYPNNRPFENGQVLSSNMDGTSSWTTIVSGITGVTGTQNQIDVTNGTIVSLDNNLIVDNLITNGDFLPQRGITGIISIGYGTLQSNTTGTNNIGIGYEALYRNITGNDNIAIGLQALNHSISQRNIAIGSNALLINNSTDNVAIGVNALSANTSGHYNCAIGNVALFNNIIGNNNIAVGYSAAISGNTASNNCIYIGATGNTSDSDYTYNFGIVRQITGSIFLSETGNTGNGVTFINTNVSYYNFNNTMNLQLRTNGITCTLGFTHNYGNPILSGSLNISPNPSATSSGNITLLYTGLYIAGSYTVDTSGIFTIYCTLQLVSSNTLIIPNQNLTYLL